MMTYLLGSLILYIIIVIPLYRIFQKANVEGWKALVPVYNTYVLIKILERPFWWFIMMIIPAINILMSLIIIVELVKCFGKFKFWEQALAIIIAPLYLYYLAFSPSEKFYGPDFAKTYRRTVGREWLDAIVFALVAA